MICGPESIAIDPPVWDGTTVISPSLGMDGPYDYNSRAVDQYISGDRIGNFAVGRMNDDTFIVMYVGRSDTDLNREVKRYLSDRYPKFKFSYAGSLRQAFDKECENYHDFGGHSKLDNEIHPARPEGKDWPCSRSDRTELE